MLKEFLKVRQEKNTYRRLFYDDNFDLYLWYKNKHSTEIVGFQLVYNSGIIQKALTWKKDFGFDHMKIDEGDKLRNESPILVQDGVFEYENIYELFLTSLQSLEPEIKYFVELKFKEYVHLSL